MLKKPYVKCAPQLRGGAEAVIRSRSSKQMFLKISQVSQETPVLESLFNKVAGLNACNFVKNRLQHRCFAMKFVKFLITPFLTEHLRWLLLLVSS